MNGLFFIFVAVILAATSKVSSARRDENGISGGRTESRRRVADAGRPTRYSDEPSDNVRSKREEQLKELRQKLFGERAGTSTVDKSIVKYMKPKRANVWAADIAGKTATQVEDGEADKVANKRAKDELMIEVQTACVSPSVWKSFKVMTTSTDLYSWESAKRHCQSHGGNLAELSTNREQNLVMYAIRSQRSEDFFWINAHKEGTVVTWLATGRKSAIGNANLQNVESVWRGVTTPGNGYIHQNGIRFRHRDSPYVLPIKGYICEFSSNVCSK